MREGRHSIPVVSRGFSKTQLMPELRRILSCKSPTAIPISSTRGKGALGPLLSALAGASRRETRTLNLTESTELGLLSHCHHSCFTTKLNIYSCFFSQVIQMFRGCKQEDMPPHIFAAAQSAYRNMLATRMDQSVVLMGHSGSGKTINSRHIMHYLAAAASSQHSALTGGLLQSKL